MFCVRACRYARAVLWNEAGNTQRSTAAVVALDARRSCLIMVAALASRPVARLAPELADQRPLRRRKHQHDRKESYSKHDTLWMRYRKKKASRSCCRFPWGLARSRDAAEPYLGDFARERGKIPALT
jgi:hypothetical protein